MATLSVSSVLASFGSAAGRFANDERTKPVSLGRVLLGTDTLGSLGIDEPDTGSGEIRTRSKSERKRWDSFGKQILGFVRGLDRDGVSSVRLPDVPQWHGFGQTRMASVHSDGSPVLEPNYINVRESFVQMILSIPHTGIRRKYTNKLRFPDWSGQNATMPTYESTNTPTDDTLMAGEDSVSIGDTVDPADITILTEPCTNANVQWIVDNPDSVAGRLVRLMFAEAGRSFCKVGVWDHSRRCPAITPTDISQSVWLVLLSTSGIGSPESVRIPNMNLGTFLRYLFVKIGQTLTRAYRRETARFFQGSVWKGMDSRMKADRSFSVRDNHDEIDDRLDREEFAKLIQNAEGNKRDILELYFVRDISVGRIANILDIPRTTVSSVIGRFAGRAADSLTLA